jgi:DNA repair protein RecO (recombination protein O)
MTSFDIRAITLRATPFQEADQVLSLYSAEQGLVSAIAKGVKKPTSKLAGTCEPLTLNHVFLARGKSLHTVCHYDRLESYSDLRQELERLAAGSVCTDIIRHLAHENDPESQVVFALLAETLDLLNTLDQPWLAGSLRFHTQMLEIAGYLPDLDHCVHCLQELNLTGEPYYPFSLLMGGFFCRDCGTHMKGAQLVNVSTQTLRLLKAPETEDVSGNALKAHRFLAYYWGHRLDKPIKSFDFLFQLMEGKSAALSEV